MHWRSRLAKCSQNRKNEVFPWTVTIQGLHCMGNSSHARVILLYHLPCRLSDIRRRLSDYWSWLGHGNVLADSDIYLAQLAGPRCPNTSNSMCLLYNIVNGLFCYQITRFVCVDDVNVIESTVIITPRRTPPLPSRRRYLSERSRGERLDTLLFLSTLVHRLLR